MRLARSVDVHPQREHRSHDQRSMSIDPVCGMKVAPGSPHWTIYEGKEVRFCSANCRVKFVADPARFLSPAPASAVAAGTKYTCPMRTGRGAQVGVLFKDDFPPGTSPRKIPANAG